MPQNTPLPAYGSPEWKAMRARMVGTPEWRAANNQATNQESYQYLVDTEVANQLKSNPTANEATIRAEAENRFKSYITPLPSGTVGRRVGSTVKYNTGTDGSKQFYLDDSTAGVYNPLYDVGSPQYQANLLKLSNPMVQKPMQNVTIPQTAAQPATTTTTQPQIQLPAALNQTANQPSTIPGGITMPNLSGTKKNTAGSNWSDLFSVAHNRYQR